MNKTIYFVLHIPSNTIVFRTMLEDKSRWFVRKQTNKKDYKIKFAVTRKKRSYI